MAFFPKKGQKCSIGALNVAVVDRDIALRPFLTSDSVSPPQNWSSMSWTVKSQNFDLILKFFTIHVLLVYSKHLEREESIQWHLVRYLKLSQNLLDFIEIFYYELSYFFKCLLIHLWSKKDN